MELTAAQRTELAAIRSQGEGDAYARAARPATKEGYRDARRHLQALRDAWEAVDHDTRMHLLVAVARMWEDDDAPLPDLAPVIDELLGGMELPGHRPEDVPGLGRAVLLLWSAWRAGRPGGEVPIARGPPGHRGRGLGALRHPGARGRAAYRCRVALAGQALRAARSKRVRVLTPFS